MEIFMVEYHDYDDSHVDSIWSSQELAEARIAENVGAGIPNNYTIEELVLDSDKGTGYREQFFGHRFSPEDD